MPMKTVAPASLQAGDEIRVLAISRSLGGLLKLGPFTDADVEFAKAQLAAMGLRVSFGRHVMECNEHLTIPVCLRIEDLHAAFSDPSVKGVLAVTGGIGAIQILDQLDYGLIASHPKVLCGYSDIAYVSNAILAKRGWSRTTAPTLALS